MDYRNLEFIVALDLERNMTRAAKKLYVSQPALTYKIQSIEDELDIKILYRTKKGIRFTPQGEELIKFAKESLHDFQKFKIYLKNTNKNDEGIIRLGASRNFSRYMLPEILRNFINMYEKVQFNVKTSWSQSLLEMIKSEEINIAIIRGDHSWDFKKILLEEEPICIISKHKIDLNNLPNLPRIDFLTDPSLHNVINNWWRENFSKSPNITMELDNIETCMELVKTGLGYAIVPSIGLKTPNNLNVITLKDKNKKPILRKTWLLYKEIELNYPIMKKFINFLQHNYNQID